MIVQLAGLPGTGKSTLAAEIGGYLGPACLVLDKDRVRHALYGAAHTEYSRSQDDFVISLLHLAADRHLAARADAIVILERTCTRAYQIANVAALAARAGCPLTVIECACPDHVARDRLAAARRLGGHPAANRDFALYQKLKADAEPIAVPALRLHTDTTIGESAARALSYMAQVAAGTAPGYGEPLVTRLDLTNLLDIAREAVSTAARDLRTDTVSQVTAKDDRDVVTDLDIAVERRTRGFLRHRTPSIGFLGEEEGGDTGPHLRWILDPVDGTANFIRGLPITGISLALADGGRPLLGVISLPMLGRTYWAVDELGAWRDGHPVRVSSVSRLPEAMIAIGDYGTDPGATERNQVALAIHAALAPCAGKVRMLGSAAADLAFTADGVLDASLTLGNRPWDMAAGVVIARAAGAIVMDADGSPYTLGSLATIVAAPRLAGSILGIVRAATSGTRYACGTAGSC